MIEGFRTTTCSFAPCQPWQHLRPPCEGLDLMTFDNTWMATAVCREHRPEVFFPTDGAGVERAQRICVTCPVREECLEYAIQNRIEHGVWGGASERARRRITQARRLSQASQT
jgi:WhiB family transcriptional regulator, redox-sensing transcriptional regulator